jgi:hypothetical protein
LNCPLKQGKINLPKSQTVPGASAAGGKSDLIVAKADLTEAMSVVGA